MTRGRRACSCLTAVSMCMASSARAGVWGSDPVVGIVGDYATNPALLEMSHTAEANGALLLDAPTDYIGDGVGFYVIPSFRLSSSQGYASLASDYEHLTLKGELDAERNTLTATAGIYQDSSLYQDYLSNGSGYLFNGSTGVKRDTLTADLNWDRNLTERLEFDTDVDSTQVKYGQAAAGVVGTLTDYRDTNIAPTLSWLSSERNKWTLSASVGRYNSFDEAFESSESRSSNLQVGFVRNLSEIWSLTASGGYSRALNRQNFEEEFLVIGPDGQPEIAIVPIREESAQNGTVFSADLKRKGERLSFDLIASRLLAPTGYAFLSQQNLIKVAATYTYSDRWSFDAGGYYQQSKNPLLQGGLFTQTPKSISLSASWRWTEFWTVTFAASRVTELLQPPGINLASTEVFIKISRQFNHIKF
jgi:hypothetical protein